MVVLSSVPTSWASFSDKKDIFYFLEFPYVETNVRWHIAFFFQELEAMASMGPNTLWGGLGQLVPGVGAVGDITWAYIFLKRLPELVVFL